VSLYVNAGEIAAVIGPNGAGKTTLLYALAGLVRPRAGKKIFLGRDITDLGPDRIAALGCALVPDGRQVFPTMTVRENLMLGAHVRLREKKHAETRGDLETMFSLFPALRERLERSAGTLSGGEQQMLSMARALMARPRLLLLDEPSTGLSPLAAGALFRAVDRLRGQGLTVLLVEQDARAALGLADRAYVMEAGRISLSGAAKDLLDRPEVQRAYLGRP
jgi:branched-chain amino acid transport system ATP-binding protein